MTAQWLAPAGFAGIVAGACMMGWAMLRPLAPWSSWLYWSGIAVAVTGTSALILAPLS